MSRVKLICIFCKKHERKKDRKFCHVCEHGNVWSSHLTMSKEIKMYPYGITPEPNNPKQKIQKEVIFGFRDRTSFKG